MPSLALPPTHLPLSEPLLEPQLRFQSKAHSLSLTKLTSKSVLVVLFPSCLVSNRTVDGGY